MLNKCSSKPEFNRVLLPILAIPHHHWWSSCNPHSQKYHLSLSCPYMKQSYYYYSQKGMGIDIHCLVTHFHVCKMFFLVPFLLSTSSIGTVWKSSSSSDELSGDLSGFWSLSDELSGSLSLYELSERNVRQQHTGLGEVGCMS